MNSPTSDSSESEYTPNAEYRNLKPVSSPASLRRAGCFQRSLQRPSSLVEIRKASQTALLLPAGFARDFCPRADQKLFLKDSEQRMWPAYWKAGKRPKISSGFKAFARENRVQPGDVCVLEVIQEGFLVHIVKGAGVLDLDAHGVDEIKMEVEDIDLAENSRRGAQRGRKKRRGGKSLSSKEENDGNGHLRVTFEKDPASGELKFRLKGLVPLEENALEKLKGPFTSGKALLKALFLEA